jgi:hypothetical protein
VRVPFDYLVVRVVPRVEREEFANAGVILHAPVGGFLGCAIALPAARLLALDPGIDLDAVGRHLEGLRAVCTGEPGAGPIARLTPSERFHWLSAPRSAMIQPGPTHTGLCEDPAAMLARLYARAVEPVSGSGRSGS